jgi:hypothetical protein
MEEERKAKEAAARRKKKSSTTKAKSTPICPTGKSWNGTNCVANPYLTKDGRPKDGYYMDKSGNAYQDNGGGE